MSQTGKKNPRHKLGNKSKKNTISQLRQKQVDGEREYQHLINEINKYYDSLIHNIQEEREQVMMELEKVISFKTVEIKNRIDSSEIAVFSDSLSTPFVEYFFKEVHYPIADFNSYAFLLNHIFLAEENIVRKSILNGFDKDFIRATEYFGQYYYLTSDIDDFLYKSDDLDLCNATPMKVIKLPENKWMDFAAQPDWDTPVLLEGTEDEWGVPSTPLHTGWDNPVVETWGELQNTSTADDWDSWLPAYTPVPGAVTPIRFVPANTSLPIERPFDFVIIKHNVFVTYQVSREIGSYVLTDLLTNTKNISIKSLSQPRGVCVLEDGVNLVFIADLDSKKVCAFAVDNFVNSTALDYDGELECEFTVQFGVSESPLLLHKNDTKHEILTLTLSNTIYIVSAIGSVLQKLAYSEFISPYDMKVTEGGKILIVDLESLVVLDVNGACMSKYYSDKFSYRGCINCAESCVEVITCFKDMEYAGVENIEICLL